MSKGNYLVPASWGLGEGPKSQILNFNYKVNFKDFIQNFVCLPTNESYKTYKTGFSFRRLGHAPVAGGGGGLGVLWDLKN